MFNLIYHPNNKSTYNSIEINLIHNIQPEINTKLMKKSTFYMISCRQINLLLIVPNLESKIPSIKPPKIILLRGAKKMLSLQL